MSEFEYQMEEEGSTTLKSGTYPARLTKLSKEKSKSGNPMWVWEFLPLVENYQGFPLRVFTALTPSAQWKVAETISAFGVEVKGNKIAFDKNDVIGRVVEIEVVEQEYNGKPSLNINRVLVASKAVKAKHKDKKIVTLATTDEDIPF